MWQRIGKIIGSIVMTGTVLAGLWVLHVRQPVAVGPMSVPNQNTTEIVRSLVQSQATACERPQSYRLGAIDSRFGISQEDAVRMTAEAIRPWEDAAGRKLFEYQDEGSVPVADSDATKSITLNFIYDDRQAATDQLKGLLSGIASDQGKYDAARKKHDAIIASLQAKKRSYDQASAAYEKEKKGVDAAAKKYDDQLQAYDQAVSAWNADPGNAAGSNTLERQHQDLQDLENKIKKQQGTLKNHFQALEVQRLAIGDLVGQANALVGVVNALAEKNNRQVEAYNTGGQIEGEFDAGEYRVEGDTRSINIYEYLDQNNLELVLAHEFGHALGFGHVDDPNAVMYYQAGDQSPILSDADRQLVLGLCKQ